jgi:ribose 5-phosphate isomerase A
MVNPTEDEVTRQKRTAAHSAVEYVRPGMVVGLGAGSTAAFAVARIAQRIAGFAHRDHPFRAIVTGRSGPS